MISEAVRTRTGAGAAASWRGAPPGSEVPFEYAAVFELTGRPGRAVQDVITLATDGPFVATAIGYGFQEKRGRPLPLFLHDRAAEDRTFRPADLRLGAIPVPALFQGVRVHPDSQAVLFTSPSSTGAITRGFSGQRIQEKYLSSHFQTVKPPEEIAFLLSITDGATGREFQDDPVHSLASLGSSDGRRPFRLLAHPVAFAPRSTVRFLITERSPGIDGTLFVVLFGYMTPQTSACPSPAPPLRSGVPNPGPAPSRVIPFDYVTSFFLEGKPGRKVEDEVAVNVEGGFVAATVGYGLEVPENAVRLRPSAEAGAFEGRLTDSSGKPVAGKRLTARGPAATVEATTGDDGRAHLAPLPPGRYEFLVKGSSDLPSARILPGLATLVELRAPKPDRLELATEAVNLADVPIGAFPPDALLDGFRLRPSFLRIAFQDDGQLARALPLDLLPEIFERINRPEEVAFRYTVFDGGRGRDLQNRPIYNIAGLGIADGDRPFKRFERPLVLLPRSTLRVSVEEVMGRGRLYMAFQGYKILEAAASGAPR